MSDGKDCRDFDYGDPVAKWFVEEAFTLTDTGELVQQAGERLVAAGIPLYREAGKVYLRWSDVEARGRALGNSLRSIGPAIDRFVLAMHEHEFKEDTPS